MDKGGRLREHVHRRSRRKRKRLSVRHDDRRLCGGKVMNRWRVWSSQHRTPPSSDAARRACAWGERLELICRPQHCLNNALGHLSSLSATLLWRLDRQKPGCPVLANLSPNKGELPGVLKLLVGCLVISPHAKAWAKIWGRAPTRPTVGPGSNGRPSLCKICTGVTTSAFTGVTRGLNMA